MTMPTHKLTRVVLFTSASKLAISSPAFAGSKDEEAPNPTPPLTLNQALSPINAFVPPLNDENMTADGSIFADEMAAYGSGMLFPVEIPEGGANMSFIVNNIRNDKPVDVFIAMSHQRIAASPPVLAGSICIDMASMEVLGGVRVQPSEEILSNPNSSLGKTLPPHFNSVVITVHIPKEKAIALQGKEVYFQAGAFPVENGVIFDQAQISECDQYTVATMDAGTGGKEDTTSTGGTEGSCSEPTGK
jgi:hypothetical protein